MKPLPQSSDASSAVAGIAAGNNLREQILLQPDGYVGSVVKRTQKLWLYHLCLREGYKMTERVVTYVPGLLKIFDEILVYAADNKQRDPAMDALRVDVDVPNCCISVFNSSGKGVPIEVHQEESVYLPEMMFGHLSNCDHNVKEEERNGFDVKLANIFSTRSSWLRPPTAPRKRSRSR
ncbi:hypothetical protein PR202_ga19936 [Eleusine coracana subsp. coracana]|uniref:DNA topoisomerase (ATP-hydrolyzing) n=1 Tax=Eleusine coracana subsp. coracana TaxID=191504 RepID=A0AAV5CW35_ELECO|nr:hypothetical protein PR202_ga19936 [Eleusine coracana subsp. coracana]